MQNAATRNISGDLDKSLNYHSRRRCVFFFPMVTSTILPVTAAAEGEGANRCFTYIFQRVWKQPGCMNVVSGLPSLRGGHYI